MTEVRPKAANSRNANPSEVAPPVLAYAVLLAVVVTYGVHALFVSGPAMRTAAERQLAQAIAEEDRAFCGLFGMRPETEQFNICSRELAIVRKKQVDRDGAAAQGML